MTVRQIAAVKTARYAVLGPEDGPVDEVWMACHGYGQLATYFARHFEGALRPGRLVVVPEALSRFYVTEGGRRVGERVGASWMTREDREAEIADTVRYLDDVFVAACARADADPRAVRLGGMGFSQGTSTVVRWLAYSPLIQSRERRAGRLVLWGGALPHDLDLGEHAPWLNAADLRLVAGDRDSFATPGRILKEERRLTDAGVAYESTSFSGGHRLHDRLLADVMQPIE
ncbi:esterase [Rubrivirga sp. S365]|uniref:Esterase n=1 Tax=Rubrivirga litoralis TaxID=3075598 RepID=A0ABU3BLW5_9BACT|nr:MULTISPECIES: esterase [unclassified Rubrivirga]MDT0630279.1 esterase [Rubrivirga sp. F394]MDT7855791.1 esterase [Rubrivirga sp. S365]